MGGATTNYGKIELSNCNDSIIYNVTPIKRGFDITFTPDGSVYGFGESWSPNVVNNVPYWITGQSSVIHYLTGISSADDGIMGLVSDETGTLFTAGNGITKQSLVCCDYPYTYLGDLPPDMQCQGDITYRRGKFYLAAIGNKLVEVDVKNPANSQTVMDFPPGTLPIHGLTTVQVSCDSVATYAIGRALTHSVVYEVHFGDWTVTEVCDLDGLSITGAGSQSECMLPPCGVFVDLDEDNSSLGFWGDHCVDTFCLPPAAIADTDVRILSSVGYIDSISMQLTGILDAGSEHLTAGTLLADIGVLGDGTPYLTLVNGGSASIDDFEAALKGIQYQNIALPLTYGMRKVLVTGWADGETSPVSTVELPLANGFFNFQTDLTQPTCHGLSDGSLGISASGGTAPYGYEWASGLTANFIDGLTAGSYPLTVTDSLGCTTSDTILLSEPDNLWASIAIDGPTTVCGASGQMSGTADGGTPPLDFLWSNGSTTTAIGNLPPGSYVLTVTDSLGCTATVTAMLTEGDTVLTVQPASICEGENFQWQGNALSVDTLACEVYTLTNGCDSTSCLDLTVNPLPDVQLTTLGDLCGGSEVAISAGQHSGYLWSNGETGAEISVATPGSYSVTVSNVFGCEASASVDILPGVEFTWQAGGPTCFGEADGRIEVTDVTAGTPPFSHSIDGQNFLGETVFENLPPGTYPLTVADASGCAQAVEVVLAAPAEITLDAGPDREIALGEGISLTAMTNLMFPTVLWQPPTGLNVIDQLEVLAQPTETTLYLVEVQDSLGCTASDEVLVTVELRSNVYAPTAFSPNGDGVNDEFRLFTDKSVASIRSLRIFDRWGELVFEKLDFPPSAADAGWDGNFKGKTAPTGIYVFTAEVQRVDGVEESLTGEVALLR